MAADPRNVSIFNASFISPPEGAAANVLRYLGDARFALQFTALYFNSWAKRCNPTVADEKAIRFACPWVCNNRDLVLRELSIAEGDANAAIAAIAYERYSNMSKLYEEESSLPILTEWVDDISEKIPIWRILWNGFSHEIQVLSNKQGRPMSPYHRFLDSVISHRKRTPSAMDRGSSPSSGTVAGSMAADEFLSSGGRKRRTGLRGILGACTRDSADAVVGERTADLFRGVESMRQQGGLAGASRAPSFAAGAGGQGNAVTAQHNLYASSPDSAASSTDELLNNPMFGARGADRETGNTGAGK